MTDKIFELADRLVELDAWHDELKAQAAEVWHEYEETERTLIVLMISSECMNFNRAGKDFSISDKTTYKVDELNKADFYAAVRKVEEQDRLATITKKLRKFFDDRPV